MTTRPVNIAAIEGGLLGIDRGVNRRQAEPNLIWARRDEIAREISDQHTNSAYTASTGGTSACAPPPT